MEQEKFFVDQKTKKRGRRALKGKVVKGTMTFQPFEQADFIMSSLSSKP